MSGYFFIAINGLSQGLAWALLALGVYITFRILNFPDLTAEGSFSLGGVLAAQLVYIGMEPVLSIFCAVLAGALAGLVTGLLNTKLKIPAILAGILTMIAMYSINIRIMNAANVSLLDKFTVIEYLRNFGIPMIWANVIVGLIATVVIIFILYLFFGTEVGSAIRATGNNEQMCRAQGIDTDITKIIALMISNALVAFSGALVSHQQGFAEVNMGVGAIVIGLASVVIGEAFIMQKFSFWIKMSFIALGSIIYWVIISLIIFIDLDPFIKPSDVKILTAILVVIALSIPNIKKAFQKKNGVKNKNLAT